MKTIQVSRRSKAIQALLEQAQQDDLIVRTADGKEYLLSAVTEFDEEIILTRRNDKLMAFLEKRANQTKTIPLADVKRRLGLGSRESRKGVK